MKDRIKLFSLLLFNIIKSNIFKVCLIVAIIISYNYAGTFPDNTVDYKVTKDFKIGKTYLYVVEDIENNEIDYNIKQYDRPVKVVDGYIKENEYSGLNILFWAIFIICSIILLFMTFTSDDDANWDLSYCYRESLKSLIYTELKDGYYIYLSCGRFLGKRDFKINRSNVLYEFGIDRLSDILYCPKV